MGDFAIISKSLLTRIGDSIRNKLGISDKILTTDMPERINEIETGVDISDTTLTSGEQLLSQISAYTADGIKISGTIETKTANDLTVSGAQVKVPAGYYDTLATKSVATASIATPSISVNSSGLITATATQGSSGYVNSGSTSTTYQLSTQASKTITPSTSSQTAVSSGKYTTGAVTVSAISTQTKSATPSSSTQYITPDSGKYLTQVTVSGDSNLKSSNIKSGASIFGVSGSLSSATVETISSVTKSGNYIYIYPSGSISSLKGLALNFAWSSSYSASTTGDPLAGYNHYGASLGIVCSSSSTAYYTYSYAGTDLSDAEIDTGSLSVSYSSSGISIYGSVIGNFMASHFYSGFVVYS